MIFARGSAWRCTSAYRTGMYGSCWPQTTSAGRSSGRNASAWRRPSPEGSLEARYSFSTARRVLRSNSSYVRSTYSRGSPRGLPWGEGMRKGWPVGRDHEGFTEEGRAPDARQVVLAVADESAGVDHGGASERFRM